MCGNLSQICNNQNICKYLYGGSELFPIRTPITLPPVYQYQTSVQKQRQKNKQVMDDVSRRLELLT